MSKRKFFQISLESQQEGDEIKNLISEYRKTTGNTKRVSYVIREALEIANETRKTA